MDDSAVATADDDRRLMDGIAARDGAALRALYERHSPIIFALCLRILRDRGEAEQVLVDVFAEVWERAERFDASRGTVKGYLALLARSRSIDLTRKRPTTKTQSLQPSDVMHNTARPAVPHSDRGTLDAERRDVVSAALASLSNEQRDAIELAFFDGKSHQEVAAQLNRPLGTVKAQIRTGLARMRDGLKRYWEGGSRSDM